MGDSTDVRRALRIVVSAFNGYGLAELAGQIDRQGFEVIEYMRFNERHEAEEKAKRSQNRGIEGRYRGVRG